jgi:transcription antitermination factor NusG
MNAEAPVAANPRHKWYIVHAYSNFEKKVADAIREQARTQGLEDRFSDILVPTEDVVEIRRGRKVNAERKFFPGYVLVKMELTDEAYHLIKNTPKVTPGSLVPSKKVLSGRSRPSPSRSARPFALQTAPSPASMARWNRSTRIALACA